MKKMPFILAAALGIVSMLHAAAAPVGTAFSYQGQIGDGGRPAAGRYDLRFGLYPSAIGGSPAANSVTNDNVSVSDGLFTTSVDFGRNIFDGTEYWLELGVRERLGGLHDFAGGGEHGGVAPAL